MSGQFRLHLEFEPLAFIPNWYVVFYSRPSSGRPVKELVPKTLTEVVTAEGSLCRNVRGLLDYLRHQLDDGGADAGAKIADVIVVEVEARVVGDVVFAVGRRRLPVGVDGVLAVPQDGSVEFRPGNVL